MATRYVWGQDDRRKELVDSRSRIPVLFEASCIGGYSVYWASGCSLGDFVRYLDELHKKGQLVTGTEKFDPNLRYHFMQSEDDDRMSPDGKVVREFPTVEEMLEFARREVGPKGRFLRLNMPSGDYIWDDYEMGLPSRLVGVINGEGVPVDNVAELLRLTSPGIDEEIIAALKTEPVPEAVTS